MTPAARVQAAIELLDAITGGLAAEQALTRWARGARYAGSKDRAAVRDHVFSVLRRKRSCAALGGGHSGRALMLGLLRAEGADVDAFFSGQGHGPAVLSAAEREAGRAPTAEEARDLPDWIWQRFVQGLGAQGASAAAEALRHRAPVCLRLNPRKARTTDVGALLAEDGVAVRPAESVAGAFIVTEGARRVAQSRAYADGLVELQDASSQAAMMLIDVPGGARVLDFCAGGGGKTLALAARHEARWFAHDAAPRRMADLPERAARAGVDVRRLATGEVAAQAPFDLVLCDVPCSGSGTWRRTPDAKWTLTPAHLDGLLATQRDILEEARGLVRPGGLLAYATCSVLAEENAQQIQNLMSRSSGLTLLRERQWAISSEGDGFYLALMRISH